VNQNAIQIPKKNFPDTDHLGEETKDSGAGKVDLLIGGRPVYLEIKIL